jgi:site-specific DNA-methyltransferase (adenine-specific)/adenine-specific DNA-methyltransferase
MALKNLYEDPKIKGKVKLIYIDPPFATKQDFLMKEEKVYQDMVIGAKFIEFTRKRLVLLRELLDNNGTILVHLDTKKGHYIKIILDEIFKEINFRNEIIWCYGTMQTVKTKLANKHESIFVYQKNKNPIYNIIYEQYTE